MRHSPRQVAWLLGMLTALTVIATPMAAEAQRRARAAVRTPVVRTTVVVVRGVSYPRYGLHFYDPWYDPWYYGRPYPPYGDYGYGDPRYHDFNSALRIEVTPKHAQVFVDGYFAGEVDDFDGFFQRLYLRPGGHEIAIYLEGYRTIRHAIYVHPGATERIRDTMAPLAPGEQSELPAPAPPDARTSDDPNRPPSQAPRYGEPRTPFGTLLVRVQPRDAEILVDGEPWTASGDQDTISIRLAEGRHRIEVRREGYTRYVEDVLIRRNGALTLNVSLRRAQ